MRASAFLGSSMSDMRPFSEIILYANGGVSGSVDHEIDRFLGPVNDDKEKPILNGFKVCCRT